MSFISINLKHEGGIEGTRYNHVCKYIHIHKEMGVKS